MAILHQIYSRVRSVFCFVFSLWKKTIGICFFPLFYLCTCCRRFAKWVVKSLTDQISAVDDSASSRKDCASRKRRGSKRGMSGRGRKRKGKRETQSGAGSNKKKVDDDPKQTTMDDFFNFLGMSSKTKNNKNANDHQSGETKRKSSKSEKGPSSTTSSSKSEKSTPVQPSETTPKRGVKKEKEFSGEWCGVRTGPNNDRVLEEYATGSEPRQTKANGSTPSKTDGSGAGGSGAGGSRTGGSGAGGSGAGGSRTGGSGAGGSTTGGSGAGGSGAGGSGAGGSRTGGSGAGASRTGGSGAGGSLAGGNKKAGETRAVESRAGGSTTGGSRAGGSMAGGSGAVESRAGGSRAGGSGAGGSGAGGSRAKGSGAGETRASGSRAGEYRTGGSRVGGFKGDGSEGGGSRAKGSGAGGSGAGGDKPRADRRQDHHTAASSHVNVHPISESESESSADTQPVTSHNRWTSPTRHKQRHQSPRRQSSSAASPSAWSARDTEAYRNGYPDKRDNLSLNDNLKFYRNEIPSKPSGASIDVMHKHWYGDYSLLEEHHGYIQWLFPIREQGMNWQAQELQPHEAKVISSDPKLRDRVVRSYDMMLHFWGMRLEDRRTGRIVRGDNCRERFRHLNRSHHNYLRITRMLKSLGELGYERFKLPFLKYILTEAIQEKVLVQVERSCLQYWIHTLRNDEQHRKIQEYADELLAKYGQR